MAPIAACALLFFFPPASPKRMFPLGLRFGSPQILSPLLPNMALQRIGHRFDFPDVTDSLRSASLTQSGPIAELGR